MIGFLNVIATVIGWFWMMVMLTAIGAWAIRRLRPDPPPEYPDEPDDGDDIW